MKQAAIILLIAACSVIAAEVSQITWINSAKKVTCSNPFFRKGITIWVDGRAIELGFRSDGIMAWKYVEPNP